MISECYVMLSKSKNDRGYHKTRNSKKYNLGNEIFLVIIFENTEINRVYARIEGLLKMYKDPSRIVSY